MDLPKVARGSPGGTFFPRVESRECNVFLSSSPLFSFGYRIIDKNGPDAFKRRDLKFLWRVHLSCRDVRVNCDLIARRSKSSERTVQRSRNFRIRIGYTRLSYPLYVIVGRGSSYGCARVGGRSPGRSFVEGERSNEEDAQE